MSSPSYFHDFTLAQAVPVPRKSDTRSSWTRWRLGWSVGKPWKPGDSMGYIIYHQWQSKIFWHLSTAPNPGRFPSCCLSFLWRPRNWWWQVVVQRNPKLIFSSGHQWFTGPKHSTFQFCFCFNFNTLILVLYSKKVDWQFRTLSAFVSNLRGLFGNPGSPSLQVRSSEFHRLGSTISKSLFWFSVCFGWLNLYYSDFRWNASGWNVSTAPGSWTTYHWRTAGVREGPESPCMCPSSCVARHPDEKPKVMRAHASWFWQPYDWFLIGSARCLIFIDQCQMYIHISYYLCFLLIYLYLDIYLSICLSVCLFVCLSIYLSIPPHS